MARTGAGDVVEVRHVLQTPVCLERVDLCLGAGREDLVDVRDDGLDVRGAVLGHELADGLEVAPVVAASTFRT